MTTGDLDGDGLLDIVAGNWGLNSDYAQPTAEHPVRLYFGDLHSAGAVDLIETVYDEPLKGFAPRRRLDVLSKALPSLQAAFATYRQYSEANIETVLRPWQSRVQQLEVTTLATTVFFNRTNRFEARALPFEAQLSPAFAINVADFDGDGHDDLFLSQNFFANEPETPRLDGGRGLLLRNDGKGDFILPCHVLLHHAPALVDYHAALIAYWPYRIDVHTGQTPFAGADKRQLPGPHRPPTPRLGM